MARFHGSGGTRVQRGAPPSGDAPFGLAWGTGRQANSQGFEHKHSPGDSRLDQAAVLTAWPGATLCRARATTSTMARTTSFG
jgi:hypothetical protein